MKNIIFSSTLSFIFFGCISNINHDDLGLVPQPTYIERVTGKTILDDDWTIKLNKRIFLTPFLVPHRDEFSETVGFKIEGPNKSIIFIPDIDKWNKFDKDILEIVSNNDIAILDGSFYQNGEIPGRDMSEIPHPFIIETIDLMKSISDLSDIFFIHMNHTNPALIQDSNAQKNILDSGFKIAEFGQMISL